MRDKLKFFFSFRMINKPINKQTEKQNKNEQFLSQRHIFPIKMCACFSQKRKKITQQNG